MNKEAVGTVGTVGKEVTKEESKNVAMGAANPANPAKDEFVNLHPDIQKAIGAAVGEAMKGAIAQLAPLIAGKAPVAAPKVSNVIDHATGKAPYVSRLQGIPVEEGQDLRHVSRERIHDWFRNVENRWKDQYNKRNTGNGMPVNLNLTRG